MTGPPPRTLGILGAGQLASMLTDAANRIGIETHVVRPSASDDRVTANAVTVTPFNDIETLVGWARGVDAVTVESENTPVDLLNALAEVVDVHPSPSAVAMTQDRLHEKQFLTDAGIGTARFLPAESADDVVAAMAELGTAVVLKTRRFGYDGKGQAVIREAAHAAAGWDAHGSGPSIVEELVPFDCELSVIVARNTHGDIAAFDPGVNVHREGILRTTTVPSGLDPALEARAIDMATSIVESQRYVGVMGVEFFVVGDDLRVNEMAPRVHNSGHWTQAGCAVDQFEQHVRAVMGLPLGSPQRHADVVMTNIIGDDIDDLDAALSDPLARVHLYGKREVRAGRKLGHINTVAT